MSLEDEIARVAYELFERDGRKHGKDKEHWLEAEQIVKNRHNPLKLKEAPAPKRAVPTKKVAEKKKVPVKSAKAAISGKSQKSGGKTIGK
jgi:Protein of unknown function (DUF2934)